MNPQYTPEEEYRPRPSFWSRLRNGFLGSDEYEDEEEGEAVAPAAAPVATENRRPAPAPLRMQHVRTNKVDVRLSAKTFEDARVASDGLKNGVYQIVNLERASPQMAERITDFLNGVCYALDGTVERVGDKVYMYVPANVAVEVDSGDRSARPAPRRSPYDPE
jgi:cell division inhibitor SepF